MPTPWSVCIVQVLIEPMAEKPHDVISVTDRTGRAQVIRVPSYCGPASEDDIRKAPERGLTEDFPATIASGPRAYATMLLGRMRGQRNLATLLIHAGCRDIVRKEFDRAFEIEGTRGREADHRSFLSGGLYNLFYMWASGGYRSEPSRIADSVCEMAR